MKLPDMIKTLIDRGHTQQMIADAVTAAGTDCAQSTISRILGGSETSYSIGSAIQQLYNEVVDTDQVA